MGTEKAIWVSPKTHRKVKAQAALAGKTMREHVKKLLEEHEGVT